MEMNTNGSVPHAGTEHEKWEEIKNDSYHKIMDLSELEVDELSEVHCDNVVHAMANIFKYGTCMEVAHGLKCFVGYFQAKNELGE